MSALRAIKRPTKSSKFDIFSNSKSALHAMLSKWDHPTIQAIMRFLVFIHTVHKPVLFCWLPSLMGLLETKKLILKRKMFQNVYSHTLILINTKVNTYAICGRANGHGCLLTTSFMIQNP